jgi:hypothetical protein
MVSVAVDDELSEAFFKARGVRVSPPQPDRAAMRHPQSSGNMLRRPDLFLRISEEKKETSDDEELGLSWQVVDVGFDSG